MHTVEAVWVVELGVDHRRHPEGDQPVPVLVGQRGQHLQQWQVGRRPRLIEPFLADRPAPVVGQPGQVSVQNKREQAGHRACGRVQGRTAIAIRSRLSSMSRS